MFLLLFASHGLLTVLGMGAKNIKQDAPNTKRSQRDATRKHVGHVLPVDGFRLAVDETRRIALAACILRDTTLQHAARFLHTDREQMLKPSRM